MSENSCDFYYKTSDAWDAMYQDCLEARHSIQFEQYILIDDEVGSRFLDLFAEKAKSGVRVRLLLDSIGSRGVDSSVLIKRIHDAGGEVTFYNPMGLSNLFVPSSWCPRNHAKTLLIDEEIGYIGSACIEQEMADWNDLHMRFTGDLAKEVKKAFDNPVHQKIFNPLKENSSKPFRYAVSFPHLGRNPFYRDLLNAIHQAQRSVYLTTPYFLPPWRLRRALFKAHKRGVDVRVMMSEKTDVPIADYVARSYFRKLLRKGVKLFLYKDQMLHAKYVVIDDNWATIGSSNMDYLSLLSNREANVIIRDKETVSIMKAHYEDELSHCMKVTKQFCRDMPLYDKIMGWLGRPIKRIL